MLDIETGSVRGRRPANQDRVYADSSDDCFVLAVADGMGGANGGEVASGIVIESVKKHYRAFLADPNLDQISLCLESIVSDAQSTIHTESTRSPELAGMGTTLTIVLGYKTRYLVGNIGDSRTYLLSEGQIRQLTKDNSLSQDYLDEHQGEEIDLAVVRAFDHVLTKSIGATPDPVNTYYDDGVPFTLGPGECLLLCSDGLIIDKLDREHKDLLAIVEKSASPADALEILVDWAYASGSSDNISAVICSDDLWQGEPLTTDETKPTKKKRIMAVALSFSILASLMVLVYLDGRLMELLVSSFSKGVKPQDSTMRTLDRAQPLRWLISRYGPIAVLEESRVSNSTTSDVSVEHSDYRYGDSSRFEFQYVTESPHGVLRKNEHIRWAFGSEPHLVRKYILHFQNIESGHLCTDTLSPEANSVCLDMIGCVSPDQSYRYWITAEPSDSSMAVASSDKVRVTIQ